MATPKQIKGLTTILARLSHGEDWHYFAGRHYIGRSRSSLAERVFEYMRDNSLIYEYKDNHFSITKEGLALLNK